MDNTVNKSTNTGCINNCGSDCDVFTPHITGRPEGEYICRDCLRKENPEFVAEYERMFNERTGGDEKGITLDKAMDKTHQAILKEIFMAIEKGNGKLMLWCLNGIINEQYGPNSILRHLRLSNLLKPIQ